MTQEEILNKVIRAGERGYAYMTNNDEELDLLDALEKEGLVIREDRKPGHVCNRACFNCSYTYEGVK